MKNRGRLKPAPIILEADVVYVFLFLSFIGTNNYKIIYTFPIPKSSGGNFTFGDANHNGKNEIYLYWVPPTGYAGFSIWENQGNDVYDSVLNFKYNDYGGNSAFVLGDMDGDSLSDIVTDIYIDQKGRLAVLESPSFDSFPTESVWAGDSANYPNPWDAYITDLDQDGKKEIFLRSRSDLTTRIYECTGNNQYALVYDELPPVQDYVGGMCWGDWDNDGKIEFAYGDGSYCDIFVYENTDDNAYQLVWTEKAPPEPFAGETDGHRAMNTYQFSSGGDLDEDGKVEFIASTDFCPRNGWAGNRFLIYESTGDNTYEYVGEFNYPELFPGNLAIDALPDVRVGDMDNDGKDEIAVGYFEHTDVWKSIGDNDYRRIWTSYNDTLKEGVKAGIYDLNKNGYQELAVSGYEPWDVIYMTRIFEYNPYNYDVAPISLDSPYVMTIPPRPSLSSSRRALPKFNTNLKLTMDNPPPQGKILPEYGGNGSMLASPVKSNPNEKYIDLGYGYPLRNPYYPYKNGKGEWAPPPPPPPCDSDSTLIPKVVFYNYGLNTTWFIAYVNIYSIDRDTLVYQDSKSVILPSREGKQVSFSPWEYKRGDAYRFEVTTSNPLDENPENDTLKEIPHDWLIWTRILTETREISSPFTKNPPKIDGIIDSTEWKDARKIDISDIWGRHLEGQPGTFLVGGVQQRPGSVYLFIKNDSNYLYIGVDAPYDKLLSYRDQIGVYIDENNDGRWPQYPDSSEGNWWLVEGYDSVQYRPLYTDTLNRDWYLVGEWGKYTDAVGHVQYELKLPFGNKNEDLTASPGDTIGMFILTYGWWSWRGSSIMMEDHIGWWPQDLNEFDSTYTPSNPFAYGKVILGKEPAGIKEKKITHTSRRFYARLIGNPSRSTATIEYSLRNRTNVNLRIYDITGRLVAEPINKEMDAGVHRINWRGSVSGIYFYRLKAGKETTTGKIILVK